MNAAVYYLLLVVFGIAWAALVWFRRRIRLAELTLPVATLGVLLWICAGFDWGVLDERPYPLPPPDQTWNIAEHTDLLGNQAGRNVWTFRGHEVRRQKQTALRIVALGSSSTFGTGLLARDLPYPVVLEQALRERHGLSVEVINAGLTGHHSFQLMLLLTQVATHLDPDIVIFYYGKNEGSGNEVKRYYHSAAAIKQAASCRTPACLRWAIAHGTANPILLRLGVALEKLGGYRWLRNRIMAWRHRYPAGIEPASPSTELPPSSAQILTQMAATSRADGFHLVLIPELCRTGAPVNPTYAALMREAADGERVVFLDPSEPFGHRPELFLDEIHPTAAGHAHLGRVLAAKLVEGNLLPVGK